VFARPYLVRDRESLEGGRFPHGSGTLHRVVLFDNSMSMSALDESVSRAELAKAVLRELMMGMLPGDTFHLVHLCRRQPTRREALPRFNEKRGSASLRLASARPATGGLPVQKFGCPIPEQRILDAIVDLKLTTAAADLERGLRKAKEIFAGSPSANRQLILLSDFAKKDHPNISGYGPFGEALADLGVRLGALCLGKAHSGNLAIESLTLGTDLLLRGQPTLVYVTVANYSEQPSSEGFLSVLVDGKTAHETPCVLLPHQRRTFSFPIVPAEASHHVEARLSDDAYESDNSSERRLTVTDVLRVLVVRRDETQTDNAFERDTEFLRRTFALPDQIARGTGRLQEDEIDPVFEMTRRRLGRAPRAGKQERGEVEHQIAYSLDVDYRLPAQLTSSVFEKQEVVIFSQVNRLSPPIRQALATFVRRGGAVILGVGPHVETDAFNETFGELLPIPLSQPFRPGDEKLDYERFLYVQTSDLWLPLLKEFETGVNGNLADGRVYNHYRLERSEAHVPGRVVLSLSNGDPVLLQRRYGKGLVLLWTTTLGGAWSSMVVHQAFLPLAARLVNYAASFSPLPRNLTVGEPIIYEITAIEGKVFLTTPDFRLVECRRAIHGERQFVRFENTRQAGAYELQQESGAKLADFFVHAPDPESDLRPLPTKMEGDLIRRLRAQLAEGAETRLPSTVRELKQSLWQEGEGSEMTTWAVLVMVLLFVLDAALVKLWFS